MAQFFADKFTSATDFEVVHGNASLSTGIYDGKQCLQISRGSGYNFSVAYNPAGEAEDYEICALIQLETTASNQRLSCGGSIQGVSQNCYVGGAISANTNITRLNDSVRQLLTVEYGSNVATDTRWVWFRFRKSGNDLKLKAWPESEQEPSTWLLEHTEESSLAAGKLGLAAYTLSNTDYVAALGIATEGETAPTKPTKIAYSFGASDPNGHVRNVELPDYCQVIECNSPFQFPENYDHNGYGDASSGFVQGAPQGRNRDVTNWKVATFWQASNAGTRPNTFKIDLPKRGKYLVRLGVGDANYSKTNFVSVKDGTVNRIDIDGVTTSAGQTIDATGAIHLVDDWEANNQALQLDFSSGTALIEAGGSDSLGETAVNYIEFEFVEPLPDLALYDQVQIKGRFVREFHSFSWSGSNFYTDFDIYVPESDLTLVMVWQGDSLPTDSDLDLTFGGQSLTDHYQRSDGNSSSCSIHYLPVSSAGLQVFHFGLGSSARYGNATFYLLKGVDKVNPVRELYEDYGWRGAYFNFTLPNAKQGDFVIDAIGHQSDSQEVLNAPFAEVDQITRIDATSGTNATSTAARVLDADSYSYSWQLSGQDWSIGVAVAFAYDGSTDTGGSGSTSIEVEDLASTTVLDTVSATQQVGIFIDSLSSASVLDSVDVSVSKKHAIGVSDLYSITALDSVSATQNIAISVEDVFSLSALDSVAVSTAGALGVESLVSLSVIDSVDVSQGVGISVERLDSLSTLDSVSITQSVSIGVSDLYSSTFLDSVAADVTGGVKTLGVASLSSASALDSVAVAQFSSLGVESLVSLSVLDDVSINLSAALGVESLVSLSTLDSVDVSQQVGVSVEAMISSAVLDGVAINVAHLVEVKDLYSASVIDSVLAGLFGFRNVRPNLVFVESLTPRPVIESLTPNYLIEDLNNG